MQLDFTQHKDVQIFESQFPFALISRNVLSLELMHLTEHVLIESLFVEENLPFHWKQVL